MRDWHTQGDVDGGLTIFWLSACPCPDTTSCTFDCLHGTKISLFDCVVQFDVVFFKKLYPIVAPEQVPILNWRLWPGMIKLLLVAVMS
jgi:hypothetical protein